MPRTVRSSTRSSSRLNRALLLISATAALGAFAAPADAHSEAQTLLGQAASGSSPDSSSAQVNVNATLADGVATGTLETAGKYSGGVMGTYARFDGTVTCMSVSGETVEVGALGTASLVPPAPAESVSLTGTYAQLITVQFGAFTDPFLEESPVYPFRYALLGSYDEGVASSTPPTCDPSTTPKTLPSMNDELRLTSTPAGPPSTSETEGKPAPSPSRETPPTTSAATPGKTTPFVSSPGAAPATISKLRASIARDVVRLTFSRKGGQGPARFRCRVDAGKTFACSSPTLLRLAAGTHTVSVASVDGRVVAGANRTVIKVHVRARARPARTH